jgi:hypothetical protein
MLPRLFWSVAEIPDAGLTRNNGWGYTRRTVRRRPDALLAVPAALLAVGAHARPAALGAVAPHPAVGADRAAPAALHLAVPALPAVGADRGAPAALHLAPAALPAVDADPRPAAVLAHVLLPPVRALLPSPLLIADAKELCLLQQVLYSGLDYKLQIFETLH